MDIFQKCFDFRDADDIKEAGLYPYFRTISSAQDPVVIIDGREVVMLGSNNYLGLTNHPEVKEAARDAIAKYGTGCAGSRFLNGTLDIHVELEEKLARFVKKPAAVTFSTGFQVNLGAISCLLERGDVVYLDKLDHACIIDGARLGFGDGGQVQPQRHGRPRAPPGRARQHARRRSSWSTASSRWRATSSTCPTSSRSPSAHGAASWSTTPTASACSGEHGRGTAEHFGLEDKVDLVMGTFSKSLASVGGFIAGEERIINFIKHRARSLIFSAAPPPASVAAVHQGGRDHRARARAARPVVGEHPLHEGGAALARLQHRRVRRRPIIPVIVGDDWHSPSAWRAGSQEEGVFVNPVVSPAVPPEQALLRTSYMATHTREHLERALAAFAKVGTGGGADPVSDGAAARRRRCDARGDLRRFVDLPWRLYAGDPCWVPPLRKQVRGLPRTSSTRSTADGAAEREVFLALPRLAGSWAGSSPSSTGPTTRSTATASGFFGFFECEDDQAAARALLAAAADWLKGRGCDLLLGPVNPSTNYEAGLLVEGFDTPPTVMMTYNPPRYAELLEAAGLAKAKDLFAYLLGGPSGSRSSGWRSSPSAPQARARARRRRAVDMRRFDDEVAQVRDDLQQRPGRRTGGSCRPARPSSRPSPSELKPLVDPELVRIAYFGRRAGRLPPRAARRQPGARGARTARCGTRSGCCAPRSSAGAEVGLRVITMGVKEQHRLRGIEGVMFYEGLKAALDNGYSLVRVLVDPRGQRARQAHRAPDGRQASPRSTGSTAKRFSPSHPPRPRPQASGKTGLRPQERQTSVPPPTQQKCVVVPVVAEA